MAEQSINIPQVIVFAVVAFLVYRWYSSKPAANGTRPVASRSVRINPAQIDTIAQMFPQLSRRDIAWDLQRNGGNAAATTERVLSGRSLESVSFDQTMVWSGILTSAGTSIIPAAYCSHTSYAYTTSRWSREAISSRSDHTIQPVLETKSANRAIGREVQDESLERGPKRTTVKPTKEEGGNDPGCKEEDGREGESKRLRCCSVARYMQLYEYILVVVYVRRTRLISTSHRTLDRAI